MKEQVLRDLCYVRDLMDNMGAMNKEEQKLNKSKKKLIEKKEPIPAPKKKTNPFIFVFLGMMLFSLLFSTPSNYDRLMKDYENDAFNDQFAWEMNHQDDNEPYPGYDGTKPTLVTSILLTALYGLPQAAGVSAVVGVAFMVWNGTKRKARELENKKIEEYNQTAELENPRIKRHNEDVNEKIRNLHARKKTISKQYMAEVNAWFPEDYAYPTAVKYFINLVEKNRISCLNSGAYSYEDYRTRVIVEAANQFDQYLERLKAEQQYKEMARRTDKLIQEQMTGNMINMANLAVNAANYSRTNDAANDLADIKASIHRF